MRQFRLINKIFCCELSVKMDFNPPCEQGLVIIQKLPEKPIDVIIVQSGIREINLVLASLPSLKLRFQVACALGKRQCQNKRKRMTISLIIANDLCKAIFLETAHQSGIFQAA